MLGLLAFVALFTAIWERHAARAKAGNGWKVGRCIDDPFDSSIVLPSFLATFGFLVVVYPFILLLNRLYGT